MPIVDDKNETEDDEMEQDTPESEKTDEDESETGTASDDEADTSEMDEEECERRRDECMDDMSDLEKQFSELREQLYRERIAQVEAKLEEVRAGKAPEYLTPLLELQENMRIRTQVAGIWRELELINIKHKFESEEIAATQNFESEKAMLYDSVKEELEEKIRRLEEDRHNIDIHSDLWESQTSSKKNKKKRDPFSLERRRKPITVTGPYIVYMLKDMEIIEDWTVIKKALKQMPRKKSDYF